jgi:hypothetical protein
MPADGRNATFALLGFNPHPTRRITGPSNQTMGLDMKTMIAARVHSAEQPMRLDTMPIPEPRPTDVLIEVKACGIVPNPARVIANFFGTGSDPKLHAAIACNFWTRPSGRDRESRGSSARPRAGDRVYVKPTRPYGSCRMCRSGRPLECPSFTYQGYFGRPQEIMKAYPFRGLCQFITAPQDAIVKLAANVSFENRTSTRVRLTSGIGTYPTLAKSISMSALRGKAEITKGGSSLPLVTPTRHAWRKIAAAQDCH